MKTFDKNFMSKFTESIDADAAAETGAAITETERINLVPFHTGTYGHTFEVVWDEDMIALDEKIAKDGILEPIIVRPEKDFLGKYEIIAGHRRNMVAEKRGIEVVPIHIIDCDDEKAIKLMIATNLDKRSKIKPSIIARSYAAYMEANKRSAGRPKNVDKNNFGPVVQNFNTTEDAGEEFKVSGKTIQRYIRLLELIPELLAMIDEDKIAVRAGVELSYVSSDLQEKVYDMIINERLVVTLELAKEIREQENLDFLNTKKEKAEEKPLLKLKLNEKFINEYLPEEIRSKSVEQKRAYTQEALIRFNRWLLENPEEKAKWEN